jgi:hypothetical protein
MNGLSRLVASYAERCEETRRDLDLTRTRLRDYEARLGRPFPHAGYFEELSGLRDQLRAALAGQPVEGEPTAADLADWIKILKSAHAIEAVAARGKAEPPAEAVTARETVETLPEGTVEEGPSESEAPGLTQSDAPPISFQDRVGRKPRQMTLFGGRDGR